MDHDDKGKIRRNIILIHFPWKRMSLSLHITHNPRETAVCSVHLACRRHGKKEQWLKVEGQESHSPHLKPVLLWLELLRGSREKIPTIHLAFVYALSIQVFIIIKLRDIFTIIFTQESPTQGVRAISRWH